MPGCADRPRPLHCFIFLSKSPVFQPSHRYNNSGHAEEAGEWPLQRRASAAYSSGLMIVINTVRISATDRIRITLSAISAFFGISALSVRKCLRSSIPCFPSGKRVPAAVSLPSLQPSSRAAVRNQETRTERSFHLRQALPGKKNTSSGRTAHHLYFNRIEILFIPLCILLSDGSTFSIKAYILYNPPCIFISAVKLK